MTSILFTLFPRRWLLPQLSPSCIKSSETILFISHFREIGKRITLIRTFSRNGMANEELAEVLLSYKQALFPGNIKKNFQHRYLIQSRSDSSSSDDSTFDLEDNSMSLINSSSLESSIADVSGISPSKSTTFKIEPSNEIDDNDVFMESAVKVLTQERSEHGSPECSIMSFTQKGHPLTTKCFGSENTTTKEQVHHFAGLPTQKYSVSKIAFSTEKHERHGFQNAKSTFPILHNHLPGFLSPQFMPFANSIPFHSIQEECHMFFDFDKSTLLSGFLPDQDMTTPSPGNSPRIHFEFPPKTRMFNSMSELNRVAMSPLGMYS
ncbi:unnamed protein product [Mytilus edulis]|uniref:Uncharacterized protein n=1 Tax=Mytilus edulis TaxID=6550 RepID=A0A8S3PVK3_MYTED|nr:unnamed protein product [Mytilus edulis]